MAYIRRHRNKWQVQVRRKGFPPQTRSFLKKADAERWARLVEAEADRRGMPPHYKVLDSITLEEVLCRYRDEVVPKKRGARIDTTIINAFLRKATFSRSSLIEIGRTEFALYRDKRLRTVKPSTLVRELGLIQHALDTAIKEWGLPLQENPLKLVRRPRVLNARERRLMPGEEALLFEALSECKNGLMKPLAALALQTAMRRGELLDIQWPNFDAKSSTLHVPLTKTGYARTIPLTTKAANILSQLSLDGDPGPFSISGEAVRQCWARTVRRANLEDLRFHDLRHEAISRFFEQGLSIPEVALISGHRDPRMLFRYTHISTEHLASKLY